MRGVNKAILVGHLGDDPTVRYTASGSAVCNISIATSEQWKDKDTGEQQERTEWHRIVAFGRLAEIMGEYLKKGSQVYIEGRIRTEKWQDKDGSDRWTTKIYADQMQMLGSSGGGQRQAQENAEADRRAERPSKQAERAADSRRTTQAEDEFVDDDIPF